MTTITENSEFITTTTLLVWCFIVAMVIVYVLPMIQDHKIRVVFGLIAGGFTVGFLTELHNLLLSLNVY